MPAARATGSWNEDNVLHGHVGVKLASKTGEGSILRLGIERRSVRIGARRGGTFNFKKKWKWCILVDSGVL